MNYDVNLSIWQPGRMMRKDIEKRHVMRLKKACKAAEMIAEIKMIWGRAPPYLFKRLWEFRRNLPQSSREKVARLMIVTIVSVRS